jgi:hypothetical protein
VLVLFKAARRQEYLHQNLRILGAPRGETMETVYGRRWLSPSLRDELPGPGEETLIAFTTRPYLRATAARFARVVDAHRDQEAVRLRLELGSRARAPDLEAWQRYVASGPNPSEASQVWAFRAEDDHPAAGRPPVDYVEPSGEATAWRGTIDALAADSDYERATFLRVAGVSAAEANGTGGPLEPPYRLVAERPYLVHLAAYNPHLPRDPLRSARLTPLYDELATAVVFDHETGVPADGTVGLLVEPIVPGPGWLEIAVSLGVDLVPAASLGWVADPARTVAAEPELSRAVPRLAPEDPVAEAAVRAHAVLVEAGVAAEVRLAALAHLRALAQGEPRLAEEEGLALYATGRYGAAVETLGAVPLDALGPRGRATLIAATLRTGRLPQPLERVRIADLSRRDSFELVLDAGAALPGPELARLTEFVVGRLLSEERAAEWSAALSQRRAPGASSRRHGPREADDRPGPDREGGP